MHESDKQLQSMLPFREPDSQDFGLLERSTLGPNADDTNHVRQMLDGLDTVDRTDGDGVDEVLDVLGSIGPSIQANREAFIRLALVPGIGSKIMMRLLSKFESPEQVFKATLAQLGQVERVGPKLATEIRDSSSRGEIDRILEHCRDHEIDVVVPGDRWYPKLLTEIADPPMILFVKGQYSRADDLAIGMVGTRHATHYGQQMAERIASGLCRFQVTVVSGLARGIDAVCHRAAIQAGGRTIAVLGSSLTDIYPPEHRELAEQVCEHGLLLSETLPFSKPKPGVFPQRNRIISGLSLGVVVVEAADRSGSLITARHAGEQGRDVFAVPGPVTSRMSRGCHQLIRDGAQLIQDAEDIIEHLGPLAHHAVLADGSVIHQPAALQLNEVEQAVLQAIDVQPTDIDQVIVRSGLPVPRVLSTISVLEIRGALVRTGRRTVARRF